MEKEFKIIASALNRANKEGCFTLEESHTITECLMKLREELGVVIPKQTVGEREAEQSE